MRVDVVKKISDKVCLMRYTENGKSWCRFTRMADAIDHLLAQGMKVMTGVVELMSREVILRMVGALGEYRRAIPSHAIALGLVSQGVGTFVVPQWVGRR